MNLANLLFHVGSDSQNIKLHQMVSFANRYFYYLFYFQKMSNYDADIDRFEWQFPKQV